VKQGIHLASNPPGGVAVSLFVRLLMTSTVAVVVVSASALPALPAGSTRASAVMAPQDTCPYD
jgi:hypothetical protein